MPIVSGDVQIDVSSSPYETGFKFNTLPFGGMTLDTNNAIRIGSAADVKLVPPSGYSVILGTTGSLPTPTADLRGALFLVRSGTGVQDLLKVCVKDSSDNYVFKTVTLT
jgi:hypothetical protein